MQIWCMMYGSSSRRLPYCPKKTSIPRVFITVVVFPKNTIRASVCIARLYRDNHGSSQNRITQSIQVLCARTWNAAICISALYLSVYRFAACVLHRETAKATTTVQTQCELCGPGPIRRTCATARFADVCGLCGTRAQRSPMKWNKRGIHYICTICRVYSV